MADLKHTPGPWYYVNYGGFFSIQSEDGYSDSDVLSESITDKAEDNARLAAAAPELLEALNGLTEYFEWLIKDPNFHEYKKAKAAIKKATEYPPPNLY